MTDQPTASGPISVLHLVKGLNAGGTENLLVLAAHHHDRTRFTYEVAYLRPDHVALLPDVEDQGVKASCLVESVWWDPRWLGHLRRRLLRDPVDIVHAHSPLTASGARLVVRSLPRSHRPRMVVTLHNVWDSHHVAVRALDRATHRWDDLRIAVSDGARRSLPGRAPSSAVTEVHGIDVDRLRERADRAEARAELGVSDDEILVGTVANPSPAKGYPDLVVAASTVCAQRPDVRFVAIGHGPQLQALRSQRDRAGLGDRLRFLGHRPDAARLVAGFDLFCLASHHEGLPLALMEALVLGVPVVVTNVGGMSELVTRDQEGILVPPARPDRLAEALLQVIDDPDRRAAFAARAAATGTGLDAATAVRRIEAHYLHLLGRS